MRKTLRWLQLSPDLIRMKTASSRLCVIWILALVSGLLQPSAHGVLPGTLDSAFKTSNGPDGDVNHVVRQKDGKLLIAGLFNHVGNHRRDGIARLLVDGRVDPSFNPGSGANGSVSEIAIQTDGKILIVGSFTTYNGTDRSGVARLNADGSLDPSFDPGTGSSSQVFAVALAPDGKIIIGGDFNTYNGITQKRVARLNANGSLDNTFVTGDGADGRVLACHVQPDRTVLIAGNFTTYATTGRNRVARINENGSLDTTFNPGSGADDFVFDLELMNDGRVVIGGSFITFNGITRKGLARLNDDGTLDNTFDPGFGANDSVVALSVLPDGKVLIGGDFTQYALEFRGRVALVNADGTVNQTLNSQDGSPVTVGSVLRQPDGKVIIGGQFLRYRSSSVNRVARINPSGALDTRFNVGNSLMQSVVSIAVQPDRKILAAGSIVREDQLSVRGVLRLTPDGQRDPAFVTGTGANDEIHRIALQTDGKVVVVGAFTTYNGFNHSGIVRLNDNGSIDPTFITGTGADDEILAVAINSFSGQIFIAGAFDNFNGSPRGKVARLSSTGALESGFLPTSGADNTVHDIKFTTDGRIVIVGAFSNFNGTPASRVAKLEASGALNSAFDSGSGASATVNTVAVLPDGKFLLGGNFSTFDGNAARRVVRLNSNGAVDTSFDTTTGASASVSALIRQPDGRILIGGSFETYDGVSIPRLARLLDNGRLDTSFNPGFGPNNTVEALVLSVD